VEDVIYSSGKVIHFDYDPMGNRIAKHVFENDVTISTYYTLDAQGNQMSVYTYKTNEEKLYLAERNIYGSSRIGQEQLRKEMELNPAAQGTNYSASFYVGDKRFELSNHLGNVLEVIKDRKLGNNGGSGSIVAFFTPDVMSYSDYYPFGMQLPGRHETVGDYRYGYQGSESDDEVKGEGNSYTTHFRQLDVRIGRWFSIDPKATAWESPYVSMGNNPIMHNDPMGDVFDPASQKVIDNQKTFTNDKIKSTNENIKYVEQTILDRGAKGATTNQQKKLDNLKSDLVEFNNALTEIADMENSTQTYTLNKVALNKAYDTGEGGRTYYSNGVVMMDYADESVLAHELKHGYQFEKGEMSFNKVSGQAGYLHDAQDEIEAYKREGAYDGDFSKRNMTASEIRSRSTNYSNTLNGPLNVNSTIEQVFRGRSADWDKWLNGMQPGQNQLLYGPSAPLFDDIIK
jgi:RHS repeat-associated protein